MSDSEFPLDDYLARIGLAEPVTVSEGSLAAIQFAQLSHIPFENFDILLGRRISLESQALTEKLVYAQRGGYCFELNTLLLAALQRIGFDARPLMARVHLSGQPSGRTHELLLVELGGRRWIADAGFGGPSLREPIPLELGIERTQMQDVFRLAAGGPYGTMLQKRSGERWLDLYSFDLGYALAVDVELGNHFTSTHPKSHFTFTRIAALHTPTGKIALRDLHLRHVERGKERVEELAEGTAYIAALTTHFGIDLGVEYSALRPLAMEQTDSSQSVKK